MQAQQLLNQCWHARNQTFSLLMKKDQISSELFFTQLIDYLSLGHFEVYEGLLEIAEGKVKRQAPSQSGELIQKMTCLTQAILDQYDSYEELKKVEKDMLSQTAQLLATRCELEDELLNQLTALIPQEMHA